MPAVIKNRYPCRDFTTVIATIDEIGFFYDKEGIDFIFDIYIGDTGWAVVFEIYGKLRKRKGI